MQKARFLFLSLGVLGVLCVILWCFFSFGCGSAALRVSGFLPATRFRIGSVSKSLTSVGLALLEFHCLTLSVSIEIVSFRDEFLCERKGNPVGTRSTASPFSEPIRDAVERVPSSVGLRLARAALYRRLAVGKASTGSGGSSFLKAC